MPGPAASLHLHRAERTPAVISDSRGQRDVGGDDVRDDQQRRVGERREESVLINLGAQIDVDPQVAPLADCDVGEECGAPNCTCLTFRFDSVASTPEAIADRGGDPEKWPEFVKNYFAA